MKVITTLCLTASLLGWTVASADVLELRSGKSVTGKYVGGTTATIRFETAEGVQGFETSQVLALTFTGGGATPPAPAVAAPAAPAPAAPAASTPAPSGGAVTVPAGTTLLVRLVDPVSSKDPQGKRFTTTLESDLAVSGVVVAKAGTKIYGRIQSVQQAGRLRGQSTLDLRLAEIALGATLVPIVTSGYTDAGAKSIGKTAKGAAAGAAIGAIVEDDQGAGKGAAIGATASLLKKGETVAVNPGTLLEFKLQQPVSVSVGR
jgi:hypothetical protein